MHILGQNEVVPLWRLGFRPFFLLAALFAILGIFLWVFIFLGAFHPIGAFDPILWHAHEMIYGYVTAVIAGFVLTASQNWTGRPGLRGKKLQFLVALWILGRTLMSLSHHSSLATAFIDLSFYPCLAIALAPDLKPADMKAERVFFLYFALYFAGNLLMHLEALGVTHGYALRGALLGLNTTLLMIIFMGGRVIPFFAESELARAQPRTHSTVEIFSHVSAWAFLVSQLFIPGSIVSAVIAFVASALHFLRLSGWYVRRVRRIALLWVLFSAYFWIATGFSLFGFVSLGVLSLGPAVHAFAVGGLGVMTYGMMSRVALGHTGRRLKPASVIIAGYVLLNLSCLIRVFGPILRASSVPRWIEISGSLWILAFFSFALIYAPMLVRARIDGKTG